MPCPLLSAADIISVPSQAEFLLRWLLPAPAQLQQQQQPQILPLLSRHSPAKELAENGRGIGRSPLLANDQKSGPGMRRDVSCDHSFPSPEHGAPPGAAGTRSCPRAPEEQPRPGAVPAGWLRHGLSRRRFDLLLCMQRWHPSHCTHRVHRAFQSG